MVYNINATDNTINGANNTYKNKRQIANLNIPYFKTPANKSPKTTQNSPKNQNSPKRRSWTIAHTAQDVQKTSSAESLVDSPVDGAVFTSTIIPHLYNLILGMPQILDKQIKECSENKTKNMQILKDIDAFIGKALELKNTISYLKTYRNLGYQDEKIIDIFEENSLKLAHPQEERSKLEDLEKQYDRNIEPKVEILIKYKAGLYSTINHKPGFWES